MTADMSGAELTLSVKNLTTTFTINGKKAAAVRVVSFQVYKGEILALVGESGSGKSVTMKSVMGLLGDTAETTADSILFLGREIQTMPAKEKRLMRGSQMAMIFQDPMTSFNPLKTVGSHLVEVILRHQHVSRQQARQIALESLSKVGIPSPWDRFRQYPHEFSGGMRQRAMIAMALCCKPKLLVADEPTTALDVTIQAQILALIKQLSRDEQMSVILITHDLGVVAAVADRIAVMYGGLLMETGTTGELFRTPSHPYTQALLQAIPGRRSVHEKLTPIPGMAPSLTDIPAGCPFAGRCRFTSVRCTEGLPGNISYSALHTARCVYSLKELQSLQGEKS